MIGRIDNVDGELIGVHRTFLDGSRKACIDPQKAMLGRAMGGAVRLAAAGPTLAVTEGIETGLAVAQVSGIPTWAALSAGGIEALVLPHVVEAVIIYADHDHHGRGTRAAREAGKRWASEGRRVRLIMPKRPGSDFNDLLRELRNAAA
jgi:putative DNA primase/helicase